VESVLYVYCEAVCKVSSVKCAVKLLHYDSSDMLSTGDIIRVQ